MLEIRVNKVDGDYFYTRINADIKETAEYYFPMPDVESIDILSGGNNENEFTKYTPQHIYRADPEEIKNFDLYHNIRLIYKVEYKSPLPSGTNEIVNSCGLCRI